MSLGKLKIKHWREKSYLRSKQELMSKPYSSTKASSLIASWAFKIIILVFFALVIIFPFYFMIEMSFVEKQLSTDSRTTILFPRAIVEGGKSFFPENYKDAFESGFLEALVFTAAITTFSVLIRLGFSITLGYALSLRNWRGKNSFFIFFISLMILPEVALLSGQYRLVVALGWTIGWGQFFALVMPFAASIFFGYMYKNAFEAIPNSVKESSMLDGANGIKYFFKIAMPMVSATTWTVCILTAFASWNSYTWPALIFKTLGSPWKPLNLWVFTTGKSQESEIKIVYTSIRMAATVIAILPMFIIYFILKKRIMNAISRQGNATKG
ncbi:carbohydrate ABC transporter permease [Metamycoplasma hominis]|uniref:carbohydrate ABC transporter permease n=1 Tax=Metamycoplasma hominis TaxID=2098 RepID=UPI0034D96D2B